jgi:hypothetical protein
MAAGRPIRRVRAIVDPDLEVGLRDLTPLVYQGGGSVEDDVPAHLRAASAMRRSPSRLVIVQDDVNALALRDGPSKTEAVLLPTGHGGRRTFDEAQGNKHAKMDLEACAVLPDGRLVAFGSGSTSARERLVLFGPADELRIVEGRALYIQLRSEPDFAGSELNVEGALVVGDVLRLFQRGNGAATGGLKPVNATGDLPLADFVSWLDAGARVPALRGVAQYDLGHVGDVPFTFTDAALMNDGRIAFLACAEASPDTFRDGEVLGCRFGLIDGDQVRVADVLHSDRRPAVLKLEGIEAHPGSETSFDVVADMDHPDEPALLARIDVREGR